MAFHHLSPLAGGFKPSSLALMTSICFVYLVLTTPFLPLSSDIPNSHFPLAQPTRHYLVFSSATVTYFLGISHLILRFSKPTVPAECFSMVTLCAACATFIIGLLFYMTTMVPDLLTVFAGGGQGGGGGQIEGFINVYRRFGR